MILLTTVQKKIKLKVSANELRYNFDARYLSRWIEKYPECFPKFVVNNNYKIIFNNERYRYELHTIQ